MHAIIGSGISATVFSQLLESYHIYDKARFFGGRISTKPFPNQNFCDLGATLLKDRVELKKNGKNLSFSLVRWLSENKVQSREVITSRESKFYFIPGGMSNISQYLIDENKISFLHELVDFNRTNSHEFLLRFLNGKQYKSENLTITAPLPQALGFFPESEEKHIWEEFTQPFNHYRKTLVACGYWENPNTKFIESLKHLEQHTFLNKFRDREYLSIESLKAKQQSNNLVLMIQFSADFSEKHFHDWRNPDRSPTDTCRDEFMKNFREFCEENNLPISENNREPDEWRVHKWRYAQAESSLMGKTGILDLDSPLYREYEKIVKKTNIRLIGDWLFGPRIERITAGILHGRLDG